MKDKALDCYEILHAGCLMSLPFFLAPEGIDVRILIFFLAAFVLYQVSLRQKSILLYLAAGVLLTAVLPNAGRGKMEKILIAAGMAFGAVGFFWGRIKRKPGMLGGPYIGFLILAPVIYAVGVGQGIDYLKGRACLFAAVYFVICILYENRKAVLRYVKENEGLFRFSGKRLKERNRKNMGVVCALLLGAMVLGYLAAPDKLPLPSREVEFDGEIVIEEQEAQGMDFGGLFEGQEEYDPPAWMKMLEEVLIFVTEAVLVLAIAAGVVYGGYRLLKGYRNGFQRLAEEAREEEDDIIEKAAPRKRSIRKILEKRTPAEQIRKYYKKWIKDVSKQTPRRTATPEEVEAEAGVRDEEIHLLYEKARYSHRECTKEEYIGLKKRRT